jgi:APA family basic amino acid/polyamine antiporter
LGAGTTIGYGGPAVMVSVIVAGMVASFAALSFEEVGYAIPERGGACEHTYELASHISAFGVGVPRLFGQIVAGAEIGLGLASHFCHTLLRLGQSKTTG